MFTLFFSLLSLAQSTLAEYRRFRPWLFYCLFNIKFTHYVSLQKPHRTILTIAHHAAKALKTAAIAAAIAIL